MTPTAEPVTMAKPKGRPKTSDRNDVTIRIDRALASMVKAIAMKRGVSAAEVLSELAEGSVSKAYAAMLRELDAKGK